MKNRYNTVGDVKTEVDTAMAPHGLRTAGGTYYPRTKAITFGLVDSAGERNGDALCPLPEGGWITSTYWPDFYGGQTNARDTIRIDVVRGAGRLIVPSQERQYDIDERTDTQLRTDREGRAAYHLVNPEDELLIVHTSSTAFPENWTDINPTGTRNIDTTMPISSEEGFAYDQTFRPDGGVDIRFL